jgi:DNA-nicking Smr family endonuclease
MNSFPEIEDVGLIEDILLQAGGDLTFAHVLMQEMSSVYRPLEQSVKEHKQITNSPSKVASKELRQASPETSVHLPKLTRMDSDRFRDMQNEMNRDMKLTGVYFRFASQAVASGDFNRAKSLSTEGKRYATNSSKIYSQIYLEIFRRQNPNIESYQSIDLHGLHVKEALELTEAYLQKAGAQGSRRYEIITGKGLHSEGKAKIKPAVGEFLKEKGYKFSELEGGYQIKLS